MVRLVNDYKACTEINHRLEEDLSLYEVLINKVREERSECGATLRHCQDATRAYRENIVLLEDKLEKEQRKVVRNRRIAIGAGILGVVAGKLLL
jgi:hypothetical protein